MKSACPIALTKSLLKTGFPLSQLIACAAVFAALLLVTPASASADCSSPVPGGDPNKPGQCAGAGNPINVMTGNKYQREEDMPALPGVLGLEIVRHYNSAFSGPNHPNGVLGRGWRLSYEIEVVDRWGKIQVLLADGGRVIFDRDRNAPTGCSTRDPANGTMTIGRQNDGRPDYTWTWTDGRKLYFNTAGKLDRITAPSGEVVRLLYDDQNVLVRVIDPHGRILNLVYYDRNTPYQFHGVQFIDTPVGRFAYEYGSEPPKGAGLLDKRQLLANLVRVRLPDEFDPTKKAHPLSSRGTTVSKTSRIYHHEDPRSPWLMTGISIETIGATGKATATRYSTFGYDDTGRAILSTHAGNVGKITLDNSKAGMTVLTNSLGKKTTYRYAAIGGEYRLLEVRGAGCALCGEPNVRYRYDDVGRLIESDKLSDNGDPVLTIRTERDKLGRVSRISKLVYQNGKRRQAQLLARYEYHGDDFAPALVARPSVVPGKELVTRIEYNSAFQPTSETETGWVPAADGARAAARIERTVGYRYVTINGRSVLAAIDGPLPNGKSNSPADSDITLLEYDKGRGAMRVKPSSNPDSLVQFDGAERPAGILTAVISPGDRKSEVEYDQAGRITGVKDADGRTTVLRYSASGQLIAITSGGITHRMQYDGLNNAIEVGYGDGDRYQALARLGYDDAGRNTWAATALGIARTVRLDTEGRLLERATLSSTMRDAQSFEYDDIGRLQAVTDIGRGTRRISWNAANLPDQLTDALGRTTRLAYDAAGNITTVTDAANARTVFEPDVVGRPATIILPNGAATRYVRDDFGRTVATISADNGKTSRIFDTADRLVASTDANGNHATYEYDVMGRILKQTVIDAGNDNKKTITTWRYEGRHLVAVDHPNQLERYSYDAKGRVSAKTVVLRLDSGASVSNTRRYHYDTLGQLVSVSLPDGSTIDYVRNGQNQITALERRTVSTSWLSWLLPKKTIVRNLERDIVGLRHLTYGNGIEAYYQRSREGSLARIVYRDPRMPDRSTNRGGALEALLGIRPALAATSPSLPGALSLPTDQKALTDHRYLWDAQGNLLYTRDQHAVSGYAYDARDRLIAAATEAEPAAARPPQTTPVASFVRYHYDDNGNRLLSQEGLADQNDTIRSTVKTSYAIASDRWLAEASADPKAAQYNDAGLPDRIDNRSFVWNAFGKLIAVRQGERTLARYRYNHRGERIAKAVGNTHTYYLYEDRKLIAELDENGAVRRQYIYLADQPIAVVDRLRGDLVRAGRDTAFGKIMSSINMLWHGWTDTGETTVYLHTNHLGAAEIATDARGTPIWQGTYSPFGRLMPSVAPNKPDFELNLRLPGQYSDKETGLYYNDHRYYDPSRGRYLSPDPLGLRGGANGYVYVSNNPLKYIDPSGLILFAFDGTNNSNPPPGVDDFSNVYKFFLAYDTKENGPKWYMNGIGRDDPDSGIRTNWTDALNGNTGHERVRFMRQRLDDYMSSTTFQHGEMVNIDIVGFSRGAAMARDFANRVATQLKGDKYKNSGACIQLRFLGLWDSVAQFGPNGADNTAWHLAIPEEAKNVFHAVALNEHRYAFPGEAIGRGTQRGFIGSHADIGGSYGTGDLSDVALNWIVEQAKTSGVKMKTWKQTGHVEWGVVTNPVLHDKGGSDRDFCLRSNGEMWADKCQKQKQATPGGMTWSQTQTGNLISLYSTPTIDADGSSQIVGKVNMKEYSAWLKKNYGFDVQHSLP